MLFSIFFFKKKAERSSFCSVIKLLESSWLNKQKQKDSFQANCKEGEVYC